MKNSTKKLLLALCLVGAIGAFAACGEDKPTSSGDPTQSSTPMESTPDESTSTDSTPEECTHVFADEYTCHDRTCTIEGCGYVVEATTDHTYGEWVVLRDAECESDGMQKRTCECGEEEEDTIAATGHSYADEITCRDRTCTVEGCGHVEVASTNHAYGEWTTSKEATCSEKGEESRTCADCGKVDTKEVVKDHEFGEDGVCSMCEQSVKQLFLVPTGDEVQLTADYTKGTYNILSTANSADAYAVIPGNILTALKELGYTTLSFTIINPAEFPCDKNSKCKSFMMAADNTANLWAENTAIAYWSWKAFWDAGRRVSFTVDVNEYAGRDIHIYTGQCGEYPTVIQVSEFIDNTDPSTFVEAGQNSTVNYIEGKGWHFAAKDTTTGYYALISASVVQYYIKNGCDYMKVSYVNTFDLEGVTNEGNIVNTEAAILPEKAAGGNDWYYFNGFISQKAKLDQTTNEYYTYVCLTDENYDFTKDIELYFKNTDVAGNTVGNAYISDIQFITHNEHEYAWTATKEGDCVNAAEETGVCVVCGDTTTRTNEGELNHNVGEDGKCTGCGKTYRELLIVSADATTEDKLDTITVSPAKGTWEVTSADTNGYAMLDGNMLKELQELGYTKLTITVINTAPGLADDAAKCKSFMMAADSTSNLWAADTAIAYYAWNAFWNTGKKVTVEIDVATYAGRDVYIFTDHCDAYATQIVIEELIDLEHPDARLVGASNGAVEYIDGKGWHAYSVDGTNAFYANISATVLQHYINNGYTSLKLSLVNNLDIGYTNVGNPVNSQICVLPEKAAGGNDWNYCNGFISQKGTLNTETNAYEITIDLTNADYDFTQDIEIYFVTKDVANNAVTHFYLTEIEFLKAE
ncbi:MAG: hypothetical protein IJ373_02540 [Clostridia bacterium]|nr:hypothetical protein [Clostridia bacterium]